ADTAAVYPMVFISAEGGASRSGYWTALTLDRLQKDFGSFDKDCKCDNDSDDNRTFASQVFAISSISGGSVGAAGYVAAVSQNASPQKPENWPLLRFAERDFLSPALAGLAYPDLIQHFIPIVFLPDGAEALERAFEQGWMQSCEELKVVNRGSNGCS